MPVQKLSKVLNAVDWSGNVNAFLTDLESVKRIANANFRLATWAKQFEIVDKGNPALCFVREMQLAGYHVAALTALSLYKCAAASMRAILETSLYYTYFRTHHSELATAVRDSGYFIWMMETIEYHKCHTPQFVECQNCFGLIGRLKAWYGSVSSVVHGQIPGAWIDYRSLGDIKPNANIVRLAVDTFCEGEQLVHELFLCTLGREFWDEFSTPAKKILIAGLPGPTKAALGLDSA